MGNIEQLQPGDVITFGTHDSSGTCCTEPWLRSNPQGGLPPLCRYLLQQFGDELGCMVAQSEEDNVTIVTIVRPDEQDEYASEEEGHQPKFTCIEDAKLGERVAMIFQSYASGKQGNVSMFLRKPDLTTFVEDALHIKGTRALTEEAHHSIEAAYEEILELQVDMGSNYYHGITLEYFQVFLSAVVNILGWSLGILLNQLLEWQAGW